MLFRSILVADEDNALYGVKYGSPLVIGKGNSENFFASDAMALLPHAHRAHFMNDGEIVKLTNLSIEMCDFNGRPISPHFQEIEVSSASVEKLGFRHFMLKEIHEQPRVVSSMINRFVNPNTLEIDQNSLGIGAIDISQIDQVIMVGCGTAYYSGLAGKYVMESYGGIPTSVELASEFRYREPWLGQKTLVIAISQ